MTRKMVGLGLGLLAVMSVTATELTIATYNIENYVVTNRMIPAGYRKSYPKPEAAKAALRSVLRELDADIVVMQEMGPRPYLEELQRDLASLGMVYPHAILLEAADPDRHVAVLSRMALARITRHANLTFKYLGETETVKRGLIEVVIDTPAGPLTLWGLHLKSRYTDDKTDPESAKRRAGEAMAIREFVLAQTTDPLESLFMILGDFNDMKSSAAVRYLTKRGRLKFAKLLPAEDEQGEHWTYHYRRDDSYDRVDHVLVSPALLHAVKDGKARILGGEAVKAASDHRPVKVTLSFDGADHTRAKTSHATDATSAAKRD